MATREEIQKQIAAIEKKLSAGAERVAYGENSVSFSLDHLRQRRAELRRDLAALEGTPSIRQVRVYTRKGL